ncbi:MAG: trypsin-like peptidase domain-containing protein [bacterium]
MNNYYLKIYLSIAFLLLLGIGIGYMIKPSSAAVGTAMEAAREFEEAFPNVKKAGLEIQASQDQVSQSRQNAITRAAARVSPATVGINVTEIREQRGVFSDKDIRRFFGDDPTWKQFFGSRQYEVKNLGSGVIISPDGYIVTNNHVAGNATKITVTLAGGKRYEADLIGADPLSDIALLKVKATDLPYATLGNSDDLIVGEWTIALGNPFGLFEINKEPTVTVGVVSSLSMNLGKQGDAYYRDMIETDAAINGGNSGGPLVNTLGEVIGINTLIFTGGVSQAFVGYGFAIPVSKVKKIVAQLKRTGKVEKEIWFGFEAQQVDARVARYFGLSRVEGIIASEVYQNSPADKARIKVGDIILEINGQKVNNEDDLIGLLLDAEPGDLWKLKIFREKKMIDIDLKLERQKK